MTTLEAPSNQTEVEDVAAISVLRIALSDIVVNLQSYVFRSQLDVKRWNVVRRFQLSREDALLRTSAEIITDVSEAELEKIATVFQPLKVRTRSSRGLSPAREATSFADDESPQELCSDHGSCETD